MKRLQLHEKKPPTNLVCRDSTPAATHRIKSGVLWSATNNAERFMVHAQLSPQWFQSHKRSLKLIGSCDRPKKKHHRVKRLTTSLRRFKLLQKSKPEPGPSLYLEHQGGEQILYLTPRMLQHAWKTALINWLHCGMKLLVEGDKTVRTGQHSVEVGGCSDGVFSSHRNEAVAGFQHRFIQQESPGHFKLYKNNLYGHNNGIPWRERR